MDIYSKIAPVSTRIMIFGGPNNTSTRDTQSQVDDIDANECETFTLEEFKKLVIAYRRKNKDFIIARVTTPDPTDQTVFYNFYYSASDLNRVLFRLSHDRRSLHRMKVKNPLNNMYIVGQVFYYKISVANIDKGIVDYFLANDNEKKRSKRAFSAVFNKYNLPYSENNSEERSKDCSDIPEKNYTDLEKSYSDILEDIKQGNIEIPQGISKNRKLKYQAEYFANDEDFLLKGDIRKYFQKNLLERDDEFIYELEQTENDLMVLLDDNNESDEDISSWRRVFSAHVTLAICIFVICFFLTGGLIALVLLPISILLFFSFLSSLFYVLCCRSTTFDSVAVNQIEDYENEGV